MQRKRPPSKRTPQEHAERKTRPVLTILEKLLGYRATRYAELLGSDLITEAQELAFDGCLLGCATLLGLDFEIHDPSHGTVEVFRAGADKKSRRWMRSHEWNGSHKPLHKRKNIVFVNDIPEGIVEDAMQAALAKAAKPRSRRNGPAWPKLSQDERAMSRPQP